MQSPSSVRCLLRWTNVYHVYGSWLLKCQEAQRHSNVAAPRKRPPIDLSGWQGASRGVMPRDCRLANCRPGLAGRWHKTSQRLVRHWPGIACGPGCVWAVTDYTWENWLFHPWSPTRKPTSQPASQLLSQPVSQLASQPANKPVKRPDRQPTNLSTN